MFELIAFKKDKIYYKIKDAHIYYHQDAAIGLNAPKLETSFEALFKLNTWYFSEKNEALKRSGKGMIHTQHATVLLIREIFKEFPDPLLKISPKVTGNRGHKEVVSSHFFPAFVVPMAEAIMVVCILNNIVFQVRCITSIFHLLKKGMLK